MDQMLLIDSVGYASLKLEEGTSGVLKFHGKFQEANTVNKNKRMYPFEVLSSNVEKLADAIESRGLFGELDHPTDSIVHLANASHLITKLYWDGQTLMGEGEILNTPAGKVLKAILENGGRVGLSSRGVGNGQVNSEGVLVIGDSYKLISFDCVCDPSTHGATIMKHETKREPKRETVIPNSIITDTEHNKLNDEAFVSYFGCVLEQKLVGIKERLRKK